MIDLLSTIHAEPSTQADRVFLDLEDAIVRGRIPMGSKLGEENLAARFGVSRGPLREALRRLEGRSLVVSTAHTGVRVVSLDHEDLVELYEVRESLESLAVRLATERMSDAELAGLRDLLKRNAEKAGADNDTAYSEGVSEGDFHYRIVIGSKSRRLQKLLCGDLYSLIRLCRYRTWLIPGRRRTHNDHENILMAMEQRDAELAEILMRRHVRAARQRFVSADERTAVGTAV